MKSCEDAQQQGAARRNQALRKIRTCEHLPVQIREAIQTILDLLSPASGYTVAWPSAAAIAKRLGKKRRTALWYVRAIKALGIFHCRQMPPSAAVAFCWKTYGFTPNLKSCLKYGPCLFEVNPEHPLWDRSKRLPEVVDREMGKRVRAILDKRNFKTTSRHASDPARRPGPHTQPQAVDSLPKRREALKGYCLQTIRERLQATLDR